MQSVPRRAPVLFGLTLLLAGYAAAAGAQTSNETLRGAVDRYVTVFNAGDAQALAALYLRDPTVASLGDGEITRGWANVAELLEIAYAYLGDVRMTVDSVTVMPLGDGAGLAHFQYRWAARGGREVLVGAMTLVFVRRDGTWMVAHDHTSGLR
ncbi:MAG: nuclear transport factor 2 family protein [Gemmatimonadales bacterium]